MKNDDVDAENTSVFRQPGNGGMVFLADGDDSFMTADKAVAEFKDRAISAIIDLDLPPEAMQTVLRTIKAL